MSEIDFSRFANCSIFTDIHSYVKYCVDSNKKEGTKNDISLSLDSINVRDSHNFYVGVSKPRLSVLGCL